MKFLLTGARTIARRSAPAAVAAVAAALSLGAYSGYAAHLAGSHRPRHTFTLSARAQTVTLTPASSARVSIVIHRRRLRARVTFGLSKLPAGLTGRFVPKRSRRSRTTLTISAGAGAAAGHYRLRVRARAGRMRKSITLTLDVITPTAGQSHAGPAAPVSIAGDVTTALEPGVAQPIDAQISNPNSLPLTVMSLKVAVRGISAPQASVDLPCSQSDFDVQPYSGPLPLTIPASSTRRLSQLGIPYLEWPRVSIVDLPVDQDGCQGASLSLGYGADARLG